MISQYGSFRQRLDNSDWGVATASGGSLTANESVEFFIQAHNRVGLNLLSQGKTIAITAGQKVVVTINAGAIKSGEDIFKFVISARRGVATPVQIAEIYVKESDQVTYKTLPISLELTRNAHLNTNLVGDLTIGDDRINGQIRIVSSNSYRYDATATRGFQASSPGYWVDDTRAGVVNISSTTGNNGCDRPTSTAIPTIPVTIRSQGSLQTEPLIYWWSNNLVSNLGNFLPSGTGLNLRVYMNGQLNNNEGVPYGNLFNDLISLRFLGYVELATGILDTSLSGVNVFKRWSASNSGMVLPENLLPGYAAAYSIQVQFTTTALTTLIQNGGGLTIDLVQEVSGGVYAPGASVLGDSITNGLQIVPQYMLPGEAVLSDYRVTFRSNSFIIGLVADTANQKIVIDATPDGLVRAKTTDLIEGEYLHSVVSTTPGVQRMSQWSETTVITNNSITLTYPVNAETGLATIRGDYPDLIAGLTGALFNAPSLYIYVDVMTYDGVSYTHEYYRLPPQTLVFDQATQIIDLTSLDSATEITENDLPTTGDLAFGLFGYFTPVLSNRGVSSSISGTHLRVAIAYHYPEDNLALTKITHDPTLGCLPRIRGSLIDSLENSLYWLQPVATKTLAKAIAIDKLIHGAVVFVIAEESFYWFDSYSNEDDNGTTILQPTAITGIGRLIAISSGDGGGLGDIAWGAKGQLITSNGATTVLLSRGANGTYLKSDNSSITGLTWDTLPGGGSGGVTIDIPFNAAPNQVLFNESSTMVRTKPLWPADIVANSPSTKCLVYTQQFPTGTSGVLTSFFLPILTPTGTTQRSLIYDPVQTTYSWRNFTLSGLLDTFDTGTAIPHYSQLVFDAASSRWIPGVGRIEITLNNILDVYIDSPTNGYPLIWDSLTSKYIIGMPELSAIEGLSYDVTEVAIPGDNLWNSTKVLVSARNPGRDLRGTLEAIAVVNATISNNSPYVGGNASYRFLRQGRQSIQIATNSETILGANVFCLEMFFRPTQLISGRSYCLASRNNDVETDFLLIITETSPEVFNVKFFGYDEMGNIAVELESNVVSGLQANTWYHLAVSRNGNDWRLFIDGTRHQLVTAVGSLKSLFAFPSQIFLTLGRINGLSLNDDTQYEGEIEDFRLTLGNARYISNFTPPSTSLPIQAGGTRDVKNYYIEFSGLVDVDETVAPLENYVPAWSVAKGQYVPKPIGAGGEVVSLTLNQISDVNISSSGTDNFLAKDADGVWRGRAIGSGVTSVNGLSGSVTLTTDQITQGSTNLYLTSGAVSSAVAQTNLEGLANVNSSIANDLYLRKVSGVWQGATITFPVTGVNGRTGNITLTSTDIGEGTRLYYTDARVDARVNGLGISGFGGVFNVGGTTGQIASLNANGRITFIDAPTGGSSLTNTDGLTEGSTNLYYTPERVDARVNGLGISGFGGVFSGSGTTGQIASLNANGKITFIDAPSGGGGGLTTTDIDARVNTLGISGFGGVFTGTATEGTIPVVNASGKLELANPVPRQQFRAVTGNHTLDASDHGKIIQITNVSTVTLPSGLANGYQLTLFNETNTVITLASAGTIKAKSLTCSNQYGAIYLTHISGNVWIAVGDLD
jgi:hypothetical protein